MIALAPTNLSSIHVYPNPLRPALAETEMNFTNLPANASVQLFSVTGEKVRDLAADPTGAAHWDGRNSSGQAVASGVYFAVIKSGGSKTIVKVAVQR